MTRIGVVGGGVIGASVAHALAEAGCEPTVVDVDDAAVEAARGRIRDHVRATRVLIRNGPQEPTARTLERVALTTDLGRLGDVPFVIENVTEDWELKAALYRQLDGVLDADCVLATNTSAIPISRLAALVRRPERVVGIHFMNPVAKIRLVEVVRGHETSEATLARAFELLTAMGKEWVVVNDGAGFVTNRVLMLAINEAVAAVQDGVAEPAAVDRLFEGCLGHRLGPLHTADLIGLDTVLRTLDVLQEHFRDGRFEAAPLLRETVAAGRLGRKTGRGFFDYGGG